jgi:hypothetical protein
MKALWKFIIQIRDFFLCFLQDECRYSIKKFLAILFSILVVWVVIYTDKAYYDLLGFIAILLGIRAWERTKLNKTDVTSDTNKG